MECENISLVVGVDGMIGGALGDHLARTQQPMLGTTRRLNSTSDKRYFIDLAKDLSAWCPPCQISVAYLCAAISSIEYCRKNPMPSARVNIDQTLGLAKILVENGAFVVFPSTNLVYDGSVALRKGIDVACPVTEYGRQKAEAESQLLALGNLVSVVRFTKILAPNMPLLNQWLRALQAGETIYPFSDMVMSPVPLAFAVEVLERVAKSRLPGVFQVSGEIDLTYEQVARYIAQRIGACSKLIQPISSSESHLHLESVPLHTTLDTTRLGDFFGIKPPNVWATIDSVIGYEW